MIRVYRFGLLPPIAGAEIVREQLRKAHEYRNRLVEIERHRRAEHRALLTSQGEVFQLECKLAQAKEDCEVAREAIARHRSETRARKIPIELSSTLAQAKDRRAGISQRLAELRKASREDNAVAFDALNNREAADIRAARATCGVYWGTYLLIEEAHQASKKMPMYERGEPNNPRFARWTGEGNLGVQFQGGMPVSEAFGRDTRMRIDRPDEVALTSPVRSERRKAARTRLAIRIGSDGRNPIWGIWPMIMHRPLPDGSMIKRATVSVRRVGPHEEWSVQLTVDIPDSITRPIEGRASAVGVDVGWRLIDGSIRVAAWHGSDGAFGELRLPEELVSALRKPEELRATRDKAFDRAKAKLAEWAKSTELPDAMRARLIHMAAWKSCARMASLARWWKDNRFDGDAEMFASVEAWRYHDYHLWAWEAHQRTKALRRRRELFRVFAAQLAERYETCVVEDFDLRKVARRKPTEDESHENETARSNRQLTAVSELRLSLANGFASRVGNTAKVPAQDTTRTCAVCGIVAKYDAAASIELTCPNGHIWDQDANAAKNILAAFERSSGAESAVVAREDENAGESADVAETKWQRAARLSREKLERAKAARKAVAKSA